METVRTIKRSRIEELATGELAARAAGMRVLIDLGTGDGKFPYRMAKSDPALFCIGVDPSEESLREISKKIGGKAARGGVDNLALVVSLLELLPNGFSGVADRVTLNFPWGTLLRGACLPDESAVEKIASLLKPGATLDMLFNLQVFEDEALRERLELPDFNERHVDEIMSPIYAKHGVALTEKKLLGAGDLPEHTSWGRQLSVGSSRRSMMVSGVKAHGK